MTTKPCPCSGCQSGRHPKTGLPCRYCSGKGYVMDGDWPSPCWEGHWSGNLPPAPVGHQPAASTRPTLDSELAEWLPVRNAMSQWESSNREDFIRVAGEMDGWTAWLKDELSAVDEGAEEATFKMKDLDDLLATIDEFRRLNGEYIGRLTGLFQATDRMFHALAWTEAKTSG
jgi:hypothetical protein